MIHCGKTETSNFVIADTAFIDLAAVRTMRLSTIREEIPTNFPYLKMPRSTIHDYYYNVLASSFLSVEIFSSFSRKLLLIRNRLLGAEKARCIPRRMRKHIVVSHRIIASWCYHPPKHEEIHNPRPTTTISLSGVLFA